MPTEPRSPLPWSYDAEEWRIVDANGEEVLAGSGYDGLWRELVFDEADMAYLLAKVNDAE